MFSRERGEGWALVHQCQTFERIKSPLNQGYGGPRPTIRIEASSKGGCFVVKVSLFSYVAQPPVRAEYGPQGAAVPHKRRAFGFVKMPSLPSQSTYYCTIIKLIPLGKGR